MVPYNPCSRLFKRLLLSTNRCSSGFLLSFPNLDDSSEAFHRVFKSLNQFFNELMNSFYLYILLSLSGQETSAEIREKKAWCLVCISLITVGVNFAKLAYVKGAKIKKNFLLRLNR